MGGARCFDDGRVVMRMMVIGKYALGMMIFIKGLEPSYYLPYYSCFANRWKKRVVP